MKKFNLKTKLDKKLMVATLIASVISDYAPAVINKFLFKSAPLSGMSLQLASAGAVYVTGALLKNPAVASIGVAMAGSNLVGGVVGQVMTPLLGTGSSTSLVKTAQKSIADYGRLDDFVGRPSKSANYQQYYS